MSDRRRAPRYTLTAASGYAMPIEDVAVESLSDLRAVVISPRPGVIGERLLLQIARTHAPPADYDARVRSSTAVVAGGLALFRLELALSPPGAPPPAGTDS